MKVLAFLQNMWVRDPERVKAMIAKEGELFRRRFMTYALFAGCQTGRRLRNAFGDRCDDIVWDEVSREIGGKAASTFPADVAHIRQRLDEEKPAVVLAFGRIACDALAPMRIGSDWILITGPHPAARHVSVDAELLEMRLRLRGAESRLPA